MVARRGLSTRFSGRRPLPGRTMPGERTKQAGARADARNPEGARRGGVPPKSGPRMELTEPPDRATPERGGGPGVRGAAGGKTAGLQESEGASRPGLLRATERERRKG